MRIKTTNQNGDSVRIMIARSSTLIAFGDFGDWLGKHCKGTSVHSMQMYIEYQGYPFTGCKGT